MADHTAAEVLAAIDIVLDLPNANRMRGPLMDARVRIEQRAEHDEAIGRAFIHEYRSLEKDAEFVNVGALIRAAVEKTGATITEPPRAVEAEEGFKRD